jgi:hypothetical protein
VKSLACLMLVVASVALMPALIFAGPAAAAKGGSKATVQQCKDSGAAFKNRGQCVSGANPAQAPGPQPSIQIENQALLLSDNSVFMTVDYLCLPGSAGNTTGTVTTSVMQGQISSPNASVPATCDGRSHTATTGNGPGPFSQGPARGSAIALNSANEGPISGAPITIKTPDPNSINIHNQALLLTDGTVVMTVDYVCQPGPNGNTAGTLTTSLLQGQTSSRDTKAPATCDDRSHTATTDNGPGPFSQGPAQGSALVLNSANEGPTSGAPITISPFAAHGPTGR